MIDRGGCHEASPKYRPSRLGGRYAAPCRKCAGPGKAVICRRMKGLRPDRRASDGRGGIATSRCQSLRTPCSATATSARGWDARERCCWPSGSNPAPSRKAPRCTSSGSRTSATTSRRNRSSGPTKPPSECAVVTLAPFVDRYGSRRRRQSGRPANPAQSDLLAPASRGAASGQLPRRSRRAGHVHSVGLGGMAQGSSARRAHAWNRSRVRRGRIPNWDPVVNVVANDHAEDDD